LFSKLDLRVNQFKSIHESSLPFERIIEMVLRESGLEEAQEIFDAGTIDLL
jgi:hypothetical protein